jgi:Putative lumazine-binding
MTVRAIADLLQRYFDALHFADADTMEQILHPSAIYATADEAEPLFRSVPDYLTVLRGRVSPREKGEERADKIISIELAGKNTALARVECTIGERHFIDFLSLLYIDQKWLIIAKVFAINFEEEN